MQRKIHIAVLITMGVVILSVLPVMPYAWAARDQASIVASEMSTFANLLSIRPETAIDLSKVSGAYCFNVELEKGGKMTHYAIDPSSTQEDVVDFINAEPFMKAGIGLDTLPEFPGKLGAMKPNQWYFLPAGQYEPHHRIRFPFPLLMRAVNMD